MDLIRPSNRPDEPRMKPLNIKVYPAFVAALKELTERVRKRAGLVRFGQGAMLMTLILSPDDSLRRELRELYKQHMSRITSK